MENINHSKHTFFFPPRWGNCTGARLRRIWPGWHWQSEPRQAHWWSNFRSHTLFPPYSAYGVLNSDSFKRKEQKLLERAFSLHSNLCETTGLHSWNNTILCWILVCFPLLPGNRVSRARVLSVKVAVVWTCLGSPSVGSHCVFPRRNQCFSLNYKNKNCTGENPPFSSKKKKRKKQTNKKSWREFRNDEAHSSLCMWSD